MTSTQQRFLFPDVAPIPVGATWEAEKAWARGGAEAVERVAAEWGCIEPAALVEAVAV